MKKTGKLLLMIALVLSIALTAVLATGCNKTPEADEKEKLTDEALSGEQIADFTNGKSDNFFASDGWSNGSVFNVVWKSGNVTYDGGKMHLGIKEEAASAWVDGAQKEFVYTGGEARSTMHYGYGDFEVSMKPAKKVGTASTFFTCTGSYDTVDGVENPWDEIDIEFLGKDTTKVQFNYFVNGKGGHEYMYDLGFDASVDYHAYGYRWTKDYIVWFVDGKPVYKVTASEAEPLPSAPGRILMNYWCGTKDAEGWMGAFSNASSGENADYQWIKTSAVGSMVDQDAPATPDEPVVPIEGTEFVDFDLAAATLEGDTEAYPVTKNEGVVTVSYSGVIGNSYKNVNTNISSVAAEKTIFTVKIKNNGSAEAKVRIDINSETKVAETFACNTSASVKGEGATVYTDTTYGGSMFTLSAGAEIVATVNYDNARKPVTLMFYFDSCTYDDPAAHSGSISLSECAFG